MPPRAFVWSARHTFAYTTHSCCAATDRETGRAKGFGHLQFETVEGAAKAIALSGSEFAGREIYCDTAQERAPGGGGGSGGRGESWLGPTRAYLVAQSAACVFSYHSS